MLSEERCTMRELPPSLSVLGFLDGGEQSDVYWRKIASLIMDNHVLRGRPVGRFHSLGGASAPSSAIRVSVVGTRCVVWTRSVATQLHLFKIANYANYR